EDVAGRAIAPLHVGHRRRPSRLDGDRFGIGYRALDELHVFGSDDRAALDLLPLLVVDEADLNRIAADLEGVDTDDRARESLADVRVHTLNDGDDGDQECNGHDHAEQREEGPEPVAPYRLEREAEGFVERHGSTKLFVSERFDGIEPGRTAGRIEPES